MQAQYRRIDQLDSRPREQDQAVRDYLAAIRRWLDTADPGPEFRNRLRKTLAETFGPDGSFGVFVRSDTNVEDLPGFTGAGLNKTVPHVVGFENIFKAIREVWASPFSERAYRWRQSFMETPEHVYASVLLMMSVPAEKSGVMVTADVDSGASDWLSIAVNEGVGGAVSGQTAEELRYHLTSGRLRLLAHATEPRKRVLLATGGIAHVAASGSEAVLSPQEIDQLVAFARSVPQRFPGMTNIRGEAVPADIEFGFYRQQLALFQIRPFLESSRARRNLYLNQLDQSLKERFQRTVDMQQIPEEKMK
jgi:phosphoenolpyruvate synthase/pyruvate phosphate dikinase